jgi:Ca-activated chloride channel family protein
MNRLSHRVIYLPEREFFMDPLIDNGEIKQIIIITGGRSDPEVSPVEAAGKAYAEGITVSAVGIFDTEAGNEKYIDEVREIAKAGGGLWDYSDMEDMGRTVKDITYNTSIKTIEQLVSRQFKAIIGEDISDLEPGSRMKIMDFIERYGGNINLKCIVVIDIGRSMKSSLAVVKRSITGMFESLRGRNGSSSIAVIVYPDDICEFTSDISILKQKLELIRCGGDFYAGAAILKACELMKRDI